MINNYELLTETAYLSDVFTSKITSYVFNSDKFVFTLIAATEGLTAGNYYRFKYRAVNDVGYGDLSPAVTVPLGDLPSISNSLQLVDRTNTSLKVQWAKEPSPSNPIEQVKGYRLFRDNGDCGNLELIYDGSEQPNVLSFVSDNLTPGYKY